MKKLTLMMGIPGSGKSTFLKDHAGDAAVVSRDKIRFSLLKDGDEYFSKEKEVYSTMCNTIDSLLKNNQDVFVDATHINKASRAKLLNSISEKPSKIDVIWVKTPLYLAIARNNTRKDTRAYVPPETIQRMYHQLQRPSFSEGFDKIVVVEDGNKIKVYTKEK